MTRKELQATARRHNAKSVKQLPTPAQAELLAMADYLAKLSEYMPDYDELHKDILSSNIDDLVELFKLFDDETNGKKYGVYYRTSTMTHTDDLTDNGKGFTWEDAYSIAQQFQECGNYADIFELYE